MRLRRAAKWGFSAVFLLTLACWIASGWYFFSCFYLTSNHSYLSVYGGGLVYVEFTPSPESEGSARISADASFDAIKSAPIFYWWWRRMPGPGVKQGFWMPLWPVPLACAVAVGLLWLPDRKVFRRRHGGLCLACGYDRRGLAADVSCPECGKSS